MLKSFMQQWAGHYKLFVGIGNVLKKDDGVGVYVSKNIREKENTGSLTVEVSIENYIGKINTLNPDVLVLIDAMDLQKTPGGFAIRTVEEITGYTTNTHNISLDKVAELFNNKVFILGIQPLSVGFGEGMCKEVKKTADHLIGIINNKN